MKSLKVLALLPALMVGASAFPKPTTSFTGSCMLRYPGQYYKVADFDIKVKDDGDHSPSQKVKFTAPDEFGIPKDFVARANMERRDYGDSAGLQIYSPDWPNRNSESWILKAKPGVVLLSRYTFHGVKITCEGKVE